MQISYVVEDIEREMQRWTQELGVGPFFYLPHFPVEDAMHRGSPSHADIDVALAFNGSMCFELIRQNNHAPSVFRELIDSRGYGFHHWAVSTRDFDAELQTVLHRHFNDEHLNHDLRRRLIVRRR